MTTEDKTNLLHPDDEIDTLDSSCPQAGISYNPKISITELGAEIKNKCAVICFSTVLGWFICWASVWSIFGYFSTLVALVGACFVLNNLPNQIDPSADAIFFCLVASGCITSIAAFLAFILFWVYLAGTVSCSADINKCGYSYYSNGQYVSPVPYLIALTVLTLITVCLYTLNAIMSIDVGLKYRRFALRRSKMVGGPQVTRIPGGYVYNPPVQQQQQQQPLPVAVGVPVSSTTASSTKMTGNKQSTSGGGGGSGSGGKELNPV
jgi:hypothetical protein